jgi:hypothetical protein
MLSKLTADDLMAILGGLPLGKEHCAQLVVTALQDLLREWETVRWGEGESRSA